MKAAHQGHAQVICACLNMRDELQRVTQRLRFLIHDEKLVCFFYI